jgi:hypothetical protein
MRKSARLVRRVVNPGQVVGIVGPEERIVGSGISLEALMITADRSEF